MQGFKIGARHSKYFKVQMDLLKMWWNLFTSTLKTHVSEKVIFFSFNEAQYQNHENILITLRKRTRSVILIRKLVRNQIEKKDKLQWKRVPTSPQKHQCHL